MDLQSGEGACFTFTTANNLVKGKNKMAKQTNQALAIQQIRDKIIRLEGRPPVMLTRDLAELYQVTSRQITQAVRRNPERFPEDFVFRLSKDEISGLQIEAHLSKATTWTLLDQTIYHFLGAGKVVSLREQTQNL